MTTQVIRVRLKLIVNKGGEGYNPDLRGRSSQVVPFRK
jgi:hypothetical protein